MNTDSSKDNGVMRAFGTGATRDTATGKLDPEGFLSPKVLHQFMKYMNMHRYQPDGSLRDSDNWQKGIPKEAYMKSLWRHFMDAWMEHRDQKTEDGVITALCGIMFNAMGYLHEHLKDNPIRDFDGSEPINEKVDFFRKMKNGG